MLVTVTLSMLHTEEGYITFSGATPTYHYYLKDHQGNNRVVMNQSGTVEQVNHYYPFGGLFGEGLQTSNQPYKYNGKELDRFEGLDLFDYGARHYDAAVGRWFTVDPLADQRSWVSPYNYVQNNPLNRIDPYGALDDWVQDENEHIYWDENATSQETTKKGETYLGKEGYGINEETGGLVHYFSDGTSAEGSILLGDINVLGDNSTNQGRNNWAVTAAAGYMIALKADLVTPEPTDAAWPKWVGHAIFGTTSAIILHSASKSILNPNLEGTTTSRGNPADWSFDPEINRLQNDKYYPPGSKPPKWFWPAIGAAGAYELYKNWPKPNVSRPTQPVDNTYVAPRPIYPYPFGN